MRRVLIATEGASCSDEAIQHFADFFAPKDVTFFILAVIPPVNYPVRPLPGATLYHWESEEALIALDRATAALSNAGYAAFGMIRIGTPAESILQVVHDLAADLIVLGTQGRRGIKRLVRASVAATVIRHAPCDVMVYSFDRDHAHAAPDHPAA